MTFDNAEDSGEEGQQQYQIVNSQQERVCTDSCCQPISRDLPSQRGSGIRNIVDCVDIIRAVEENECLYNKQHKDYKNQVIKDDAWEKVYRTSVVDWENLLDVDKLRLGLQIQKRWRSIRDAYMRALKSPQKPPREEKDDGVFKKRRYIYASYLEWLEPYLTFGDRKQFNEKPAEVSQMTGPKKRHMFEGKLEETGPPSKLRVEKEVLHPFETIWIKQPAPETPPTIGPVSHKEVSCSAGLAVEEKEHRETSHIKPTATTIDTSTAPPAANTTDFPPVPNPTGTPAPITTPTPGTTPPVPIPILTPAPISTLTPAPITTTTPGTTPPAVPIPTLTTAPISTLTPAPITTTTPGTTQPAVPIPTLTTAPIPLSIAAPAPIPIAVASPASAQDPSGSEHLFLMSLNTALSRLPERRKWVVKMQMIHSILQQEDSIIITAPQ